MVVWQAPGFPLAGCPFASLVSFCASWEGAETEVKGVEFQAVPGPPWAGPPLLGTRDVLVGAHQLFLPEPELAQSGKVQWWLLLVG